MLSLGWAASLRNQVRRGTQELRAEIAERQRVESEVEQLRKSLRMASREAGLAEVATSVLHNVGNVLSSINVSTSLVGDKIKQSRAGNIAGVATLLLEHTSDLGEFMTRDSKGQQVPAYLKELSGHLAREQTALLQEIDSLNTNVAHINDIIAMQQDYARVSGMVETVPVVDLINDAVRLNSGALARHDVQLCREYETDLPRITVEKHKVLQILVNLIRNAKYACDESGRQDKRVVIRACRDGHRVTIDVADNGIGISPENLTRIFAHRFTTRKNGHGFGLHSGTVAAKELGGALRAHSDGIGRGATFTLVLPLRPLKEPHA
jgi:C4-dicarboxylate-specific signal transduction histidine kinase